MRFLFQFFKTYAIVVLGSQKAADAAGSEAGMDFGTALARQAWVNPYGEALRRRVFAPPGADAVAEGRIGEKSSSQSGVARKPLKSPDSRKKEAWISLP